MLLSYDSDCNTTTGSFIGPNCGYITIDVNGIQPPNTRGLDIYNIVIYENGLKPASPPSTTYTCIRGNTGVNNDGRYCAVKVITNQDY